MNAATLTLEEAARLAVAADAEATRITAQCERDALARAHSDTALDTSPLRQKAPAPGRETNAKQDIAIPAPDASQLELVKLFTRATDAERWGFLTIIRAECPALWARAESEGVQ